MQTKKIQAIADSAAVAGTMQKQIEAFIGPEGAQVIQATIENTSRPSSGIVATIIGLATMLLAAPGDNYWHQLYGIDVALWAPFHLMGLVGGGIAGLGAIHALAAEVARARARGWLRPRLLGYSDGWLVYSTGREIHVYSYQRKQDSLARTVRTAPVTADAAGSV